VEIKVVLSSNYHTAASLPSIREQFDLQGKKNQRKGSLLILDMVVTYERAVSFFLAADNLFYQGFMQFLSYGNGLVISLYN
jgi:hypothetical protein